MSGSLRNSAVVAVPGRRPTDPAERWLPSNPSAWLLLLAPALIAAVATVREHGDAPNHLWPMLLCWVFGRCAYSAAAPRLAGLWDGEPVAASQTTAHSSPATRADWFRQRPVLVWTSLAVLCAGLAIAESGWRVLGWAGVYLPLTALALWLCAHNRHGSPLTGMLSVAAACLVPLTLVHPDPADLRFAAGGAVLSLVSLGYLCGAGLHLRALTPHRRLTRRRLVSIGWHALVAAIAVVTAAAGGAAGPWALFFGLIMIRALLVPLLAPVRGRTKPARTAVLGEAVVALVFCGLALTTLAPITVT